ncbi:hypothetical protein [Candidatus Palauibacter polyketidifaciens]|uniref:hypothetical protein n=1 Tax=Candidatus Palauibacter polyketidifaciens TaxID=3056740 RepID=UPI00239E3A2F|nr:hypothetical protein [Candidatus Palauibacter polyketidifaciens]MDE2720092.1 hypothetical protein [Candidatus Palauibacter polyketidifaciens]
MNAPGSRCMRGVFPLIAFVTVACAEDPAPRVSAEPVVDMEAFEEAFEVVRVVTLEETDDVISVTPRIVADGQDGLIIVEPQESQVREYGRDGTLRAVHGRAGGGPGEFQMPISARRTSDGTLVVPDIMLGRLTFLGADTLVDAAPVAMLLDAHDLGGGELLLTGMGNQSADRPRFLHIWDMEADRIERSFFPMGISDRDRPTASAFASASASLVGDTIWAVWSLSDTVYQYSLGGDLLSAIPIPLVRPRAALPSFARQIDVSEAGTALDSVSQVSRVLVAEGDGLAVTVAHMRGIEYEWDLVVMDRDGTPRVQLRAAPRLLLVDRDEFWFSDPQGLQPNRILVARRRDAP